MKIGHKPARRTVLLVAAAVALSPMAASAQDAAKAFPSKPIVLVVPYAAGGSSHTRARQVAEKTRVVSMPSWHLFGDRDDALSGIHPTF